MKPTRQEWFKLALFLVISATLLLLLALLSLGITPWQTSYTIYTAQFKENIGGLEKGAPVKYQGLRIGRVKDMQVAASDIQAILVYIELPTTLVLHQGTVIYLDTAGLTGLRTLNLVPGPNTNSVLTPDQAIPTGPSLFDKITDSASVIVSDVRRVADELVQLANQQNRERLEHLLSTLDTFLTSLNKVLQHTEQPVVGAIQQFQQTAIAVEKLALQATQILQTGEGILTETGSHAEAILQDIAKLLRPLPAELPKQTLLAVRNAAQQIEQRVASADTGEALNRASTAMRQLDVLIGDVDVAVRAGRQDFTATLSYLRQAAEDLREFSRILAQNPSVLVRGREEGGR